MRRRNVWVVAVAIAVVAVAAPTSSAAGAGQPRLAAPVVLPGPMVGPALRSGTLRGDRANMRARRAWGGTYTTTSGEQVSVTVSDAYPRDEAAAQGWADYLGSLVHGSELGSVRLYLAPAAEVTRSCGQGTLGCYGGNEIVALADADAPVPPTQIVAHEYGHHIAAHRVNLPWNAVDWGPKRWATYASVCTRTRAGTVFPGDEDAHYFLNPGEGFAEVYRALNNARAGATLFDWRVVDRSFYPDAGALTAAEDDVLRPWATQTARVVRARFTAKGATSWTFSLPTPLDGELHVRLAMPLGGAYDLTLLDARGTRLARGLLGAGGTVSADAQICGERGVTVRVVRRGSAGAFSVAISSP